MKSIWNAYLNNNVALLLNLSRSKQTETDINVWTAFNDNKQYIYIDIYMHHYMKKRHIYKYKLKEVLRPFADRLFTTCFTLL